jgi:hypothetical protein
MRRPLPPLAALAAPLVASVAIAAAAPRDAQAEELPPTAAQRATLPREAEPVRPVPPPPPPAVSRTRMNCVGCAITGGVFLGAGALQAAIGGIELYDPAPGEEDGGRFLLVMAGIHGVVGIPLLVIGLWPVETTGARAAGDLQVHVGPTGGTVDLAF